MTERALILIDFINEIVHPDGKLAGKGYSDYVARNAVNKAVAELLVRFRKSEDLVVHVRVGFEPNYVDHPEASPLFGAAKKFGALNSATWGHEFVDFATPSDEEVVIRKRRVSAFFDTGLDLILRAQGVKKVLVAGCATDLAVQSAVRDAHDRDYCVVVLSDCCAAASDQDHQGSIQVLSKLAEVVDSSDLFENG